MFEIAENGEEREMNGNAKILVVGVGGGGCNAVNTMIKSGLTGVEYVVANTDAQSLKASLAPIKLQLGAEITKGLGAGSNPEVGRKAALEEYEKLSDIINGADMVFVTAGMGGGTGTGAAPIIAKLSRELGALTVGVVTKPFLFEGKRRFRQAESGIQELEDCVDSLITIPNQRLLYLAGESLSLVETFKRADEVLLNAVQGISDLINNTGLINADFADVSTVMANKGFALMGTGICAGQDRAIKAATEAISSPLLEDITIDGATGIIINITGNETLTTHETNEAVTLIMEAADEDAEIIFGTVIDESMGENLKVTVIATGLNSNEKLTRKTSENVNSERDTNAVTSTKQEDKLSITDQLEMIDDEESRRTSTTEDRASKFSSLDKELFSTSVKKEEDRPLASNLVNSIQQAASHYEQSKENTKRSEKPAAKSTENYSSKDNANSSRARSIAERLGFINFDEDEFDSPSYLRKDEDRRPPESNI